MRKPLEKDDGISEVVSTLMLLAIVTLFVCGITLVSMAAVNDQAETVPVVSFRLSESDQYLYHAGGDALLKSEIRVYYRDTDITDKTRIDGKVWDVWETGEALDLTSKYSADLITIVAKTSAGRVVILYTGIQG